MSFIAYKSDAAVKTFMLGLLIVLLAHSAYATPKKEAFFSLHAIVKDITLPEPQSLTEYFFSSMDKEIIIDEVDQRSFTRHGKNTENRCMVDHYPIGNIYSLKNIEVIANKAFFEFDFISHRLIDREFMPDSVCGETEVLEKEKVHKRIQITLVENEPAAFTLSDQVTVTFIYKQNPFYETYSLQ